MLQDRPLYEELARLGSRGRWFWLVGNWLVYAGLLGIILLLLAWPAVLYFKIGDAGLLFFVLLVASAGLFTAGSFLKKISYRIALNEGIDVPKFLQGPDGPKP